jgi:hypothetical protein
MDRVAEIALARSAAPDAISHDASEIVLTRHRYETAVEGGYKNDSLSLSDREWTCPACATHHMRDFNSAKNVKSEGLKVVAAGYRRRKTLVDCESVWRKPASQVEARILCL